MTATDLLAAGNLSQAIAEISGQVKSDPSDFSKRTFLFELLCFAGDLERAGRQLDIIASQNARSELAVQSFRSILGGEEARRLLFSNGRRPGLAKNVPPYTELHLKAIDYLRAGQPSETRKLLEQAEEERPAISVQVNGKTFDDLKDGDDVIGPFLEVITSGNYGWVPWESIKAISIDPPRRLRDLIWLPAAIELHIGPLADAWIPVLYIDSWRHTDEQVKLGRRTEWQTAPGDLTRGLGQRVLVAGEDDFPILEIRNLEFADSEAAHAHASDH